MLTTEEKNKVLYTFNDTASDYSGPSNYCDLFYLSVHSHPEHTAVIFEDVSLTYQELDL